MDSKDVLSDLYSRIQRTLQMSLKDLSPEQLRFRPGPESNSIAWLAWHLTRQQDRQISDLLGRDQAWIAGGWHAKFDKPADPDDTGQRYTAEQVAAIQPASAQLLLDYFDAVLQRSTAYLQTVTSTELDRVLDEPQWNPPPTVGVRLVSIAVDGVQHAGQAAYLRGLIEAKRWFPA